jgi:hypothetical protein
MRLGCGAGALRPAAALTLARPLEGERAMGRTGAFVLLAAALLALSACMSPQEVRAMDEATCRGYGFHDGTTEFATCLQREQLAREYYWSSPYAFGPYPEPLGF